MLKNKSFLLIFLLLLCFNHSFSQFVAERIAVEYQAANVASRFNVDEFYDLTQMLPENYVRDGSEDYTAHLQKGIDNNKKVKMPNFPIMVTGIFVNDDSEVLFDSKSKLLMKPTEKGRYRIIGVHGVENVKIFSPVIVGDRRSHLGDSGEWGYGIEVKASKNIQILDPYITECWGDGIIITESTSNMRTGKKGGKVENILVKGGTLDYNRRNGVTVTAGQDIKLEGINVANTMGTAPKAGIMIEPDNANATLKNVSIDKTNISNCPLGIGINITKLSNSNKGNSTSISIQNTVVRNTLVGVQVAGFAKAPKKRKITGEISLSGITFKENDRDLVYRNGYGIIPVLRTTGVKVFKKGKAIRSKDELLKGVANPNSVVFQ